MSSVASFTIVDGNGAVLVDGGVGTYDWTSTSGANYSSNYSSSHNVDENGNATGGMVNASSTHTQTYTSEGSDNSSSGLTSQDDFYFGQTFGIVTNVDFNQGSKNASSETKIENSVSEFGSYNDVWVPFIGTQRLTFGFYQVNDTFTYDASSEQKQKVTGNDGSTPSGDGEAKVTWKHNISDNQIRVGAYTPFGGGETKTVDTRSAEIKYEKTSDSKFESQSTGTKFYHSQSHTFNSQQNDPGNSAPWGEVKEELNTDSDFDNNGSSYSNYYDITPVDTDEGAGVTSIKGPASGLNFDASDTGVISINDPPKFDPSDLDITPDIIPADIELSDLEMLDPDESTLMSAERAKALLWARDLANSPAPIVEKPLDLSFFQAVAEITAGTIFEPIDWALTAREIYNEPGNWTSYAGLLPFVPAGTKNLFKAVDKGGELGKAAKVASESVDEVYDASSGKLKVLSRLLLRARNFGCHTGRSTSHSRYSQR